MGQANAVGPTSIEEVKLSLVKCFMAMTFFIKVVVFREFSSV